MPSLSDFESALNEVVQAKRLSQSKVTKLTEVAMQLMDQDTQLVSTLYRTHKSLPAACKVSSLYVFDALARAARHQVGKHNLSDRHPGNCATFLMKMAGILEGLFQDMLASGIPEAKEKTKKIHDIWVKGNTFSSAILNRLSDIVTEKEKVLEVNTSVTTDPRMTNASVLSPQSSTPVSTPVTDAQSSLLALLARAADQKISQTPINTTTTSNATLDAAQLAVLQYLQLASARNSVSSQTTLATPAPILDTHVNQTTTEAAMPKSPSSHDDPIPTRQGERYGSYHSPSQSDHHYSTKPEDRSYPRNEHRDYSRRRGRWNRWDERDRDRDRHRDFARDSPRRKDPSRSRSPVDSRFQPRKSPPHKHSSRHSSDVSWTRNSENEVGGPSHHDAGKDEFGRDLRLSSPTTKVSDPRDVDISHTTSSIPTGPKGDSLTISTSNDPMSRSSIAYTSSKDPVASVTSTESITESSQAGLNNFDIATFDFTSPSSWEAVAKMWQVTHGYQPSAEEIMQFVMMGVMSQQVSSTDWGNAVSDSQGDSGVAADSFSRGGGSYSGGFHGNIRNAQQPRGWTGHDGAKDQLTDAVVLGGESSDKGISSETSGDDQQRSAAGGSGGRMQKVGDKWMFVRNDNSI